MLDHKDNKPADGKRGRWSWAFSRRPDRGWTRNRFLIGAPGNPMMERWRLLQTPLFGIYLHRIYREDLDPVPHDHPWSFLSLVLRGGYQEEFYPDTRRILDRAFTRRFGGLPRLDGRPSRRLHRFPLTAAHRITAVEPGTVTLVLVGPKVRSWGFYGYDGLWIDWRDALGVRPTEGARSTGKYSA